MNNQPPDDAVSSAYQITKQLVTDSWNVAVDHTIKAMEEVLVEYLNTTHNRPERKIVIELQYRLLELRHNLHRPLEDKR
jgi:hypothetical protein